MGRPGRRAIKAVLPVLRREMEPDFVIANAENAAGGRGLTRDIMEDLLSMGIDVMTMGNHVWDNKDILRFIDDEPRLIRPLNFPEPCPGQGYHIYTAGFNKRVAVVNALGRVFLPPLDCPFVLTDAVVNDLKEKADIIIIDFHAEATSEKVAFGYYFDGRVQAVLGTHTHIQTSDERILPQGTAYITDLGMTGPYESVLGMKKEQALEKFLSGRPVRLEVASGTAQLQGVLLILDEDTDQVSQIIRISRQLPE